MEKILNPNHPLKGSNMTLSPIPEEKIQAIKKMLNDNPRNLLLFTLGINNGLRVKDILELQIKHLKNCKPGDTFPIIETKTGKKNIVCINKEVHKVWKMYLEKYGSKTDDDYVFFSKKGGALTSGMVNKLIKGWCKDVGLAQERYGCHSLRKTFGYIQRTKFGVGFEILCKRYNHSSPAITIRYLGIADHEVNGILLNEI